MDFIIVFSYTYVVVVCDLHINYVNDISQDCDFYTFYNQQ